MKAFWWQEGLHIEPESKEERTALVLLLDSIRPVRLGNESGEFAGVFQKNSIELVIGDHQVGPCAGASTVEEFAR